MAIDLYDTIVLLDNHPAMLHGLSSIVEKKFRHVYQYNNPQKGLALINEKKPEMVILDYHFSDRHGGLICRKIKSQSPNTRVLGISFNCDYLIINQLVSARVDGFMLKSSSNEDLLDAVAYIMKGGKFFCREAKECIQNFSTVPDYVEWTMVGDIKFSRNELETMRLLCQELSFEEIAEMLFLSPKTIKLDKASIIKKTGSKTIAGIMKFALQKNIIELHQL